MQRPQGRNRSTVFGDQSCPRGLERVKGGKAGEEGRGWVGLDMDVSLVFCQVKKEVTEGLFLWRLGEM